MKNPNLLSVEEICGLLSNGNWLCLVPKGKVPPSAFWDEMEAQKMIRDFLRTTLLNKLIYGAELMITPTDVLVAFLMDRDIALVLNPLSGDSTYWFKGAFVDGDIVAPSWPELSGQELWDMMPHHPDYRDEGYQSPLDRHYDDDSEFELEFDLPDDESSEWDLNLPPKPPKVVAADSEFELVLELDDDDNLEPRLKTATESEGVHNAAESFIDEFGQIHRPGLNPEAVDAVLELDDDSSEWDLNLPKGGVNPPEAEIVDDSDDDIPFNEDMKRQ